MTVVWRSLKWHLNQMIRIIKVEKHSHILEAETVCLIWDALPIISLTWGYSH